MPVVATQGPLKPADIVGEYYPSVQWFLQKYYVNQYPLATQLKREPVNSQTFNVRHWKHRPRYFPLGVMNNTDVYSAVTIAALSALTLGPNGLGDSTNLQVGDILQVDSEQLEVLATPSMDVGASPRFPAGSGITIPAAGTIWVRRAVAGTTIAAHTAGTVSRLYSNARDGGEFNQSGTRAKPYNFVQTVQNFQYPVQVGGAVESNSSAYGLEGGSTFEITKMQAMENMMYDVEYSSMYGQGQVPGVYGDGSEARFLQTGIKYQVKTNQITASNPTAYTRQNFVQDVLAPLWRNGSKPDIILGSADFLAGLVAWSAQAMRIPVGERTLGLDIEMFETNLAPGLMVVPCITMNPGDLFVGMRDLMFMRVKQNEEFWPRGTRGYIYEGDWVAEMAAELRDEEKHAFLSGVTNYSA